MIEGLPSALLQPFRLLTIALFLPIFPAFAEEDPVDTQETGEQGAETDAPEAEGETLAFIQGAEDAPSIARPDAFEEPATASAPGRGFLSFSADVGVATAYAARGINVFQSSSQKDPNALFAPALEVGLGDTGLAVGWLSALQLTGPNREEMVANGVGAENDVYVAWSHALGETVELGAVAALVAYPLADADTVGAGGPLLLEPAVNVTWSGPIELGAEVLYSAGIQPAAPVPPYAYLNLTGEKGFDLGSGYGVTLGAGAGFKAYTVPDAPKDNVWDVSLDLALQKDFDNGLYLTPGVHGAWTNLEGKDVAQSMFVWAGMNVGVTL